MRKAVFGYKKTSIMFNKVNGKISAITMSAVAFIAPTDVSAAEIALTFENLGVTLAGEFAGFQQDAYIIIANGAPLHVPAVLVTCEGDFCFDIAGAAAPES